MLVFAIPGRLDEALARWTRRLYDDFAALHHWDLWSRATVYRVFLLPGWLEVDIAFAPATEFGPLGPHWRTVFGEVVDLAPAAAPSAANPAGLAWHHALHARVCIERHRHWQAEHWIGALRTQVFAMACLRMGWVLTTLAASTAVFRVRPVRGVS
jgi:hypothetical protein